MKKNIKEKLILDSYEQLYLYGYRSKFSFFRKLLVDNRIPKCSLLSGAKGIGKATFAYHLVNYLLSHEEKNNYSLEQQKINPENHTYKLLKSNIHPNFYLLNSIEDGGEIKIDQVRALLKFLRNTTYNKNIKVVMIDNIENLNKNSSNALLKCLEEHTNNTFFLLVYDDTKKLLSTIKSRCVEFKIYLKNDEKYSIFEKLTQQYFDNLELKNFFETFYFETPGNLIKYITSLDMDKIDILSNKFDNIEYLINEYLKEDKPEILSLLLVLIEKFYNNLYLSNISKINIFYYNKFKILNLINEMKLYNLDKKNTFLGIKNIIQTDAR